MLENLAYLNIKKEKKSEVKIYRHYIDHYNQIISNQTFASIGFICTLILCHVYRTETIRRPGKKTDTNAQKAELKHTIHTYRT